MSYKSMFFDAVNIGDSDNEEYDRVYDASDFAEYFSRFISNGVFVNPANSLLVSQAGGMSVTINAGYAWINGYMFSIPQGSTESLTLPVANPTLNRYDSVILGLDLNNRQITPYIKSGPLANSPVPVELVRDSFLYEIELATVYVEAGTAQITKANITDVRPTRPRCGFVASLVEQIDTSGLFEQFTAAFNAWFEDLQTTLDDNVAATLANRIQTLENNQVKIKNLTYQGSRTIRREIKLPFLPKRVLISGFITRTISGAPNSSRHELDIAMTSDTVGKGIYTRTGDTVAQSVSAGCTQNSDGTYTLYWSSNSATYSCNEYLETYYLTAWG